MSKNQPEEPVSKGECGFCGKTFAKRGIGRHLGSHLNKMAKEYKGKPGRSYLVSVTASDFFLCLWVNGEATMEDVDSFLRAIWLECCGHMSSFEDRKNDYTDLQKELAEEEDEEGYAEEEDDESMGFLFGAGDYAMHEVPMESPAFRVMQKGKTFKYTYDFGSSTVLDVKVVNEYPLPASFSVVLLSRNEPLPIYCDMCRKKPAVEICTVDYTCFCKSCAAKHAKTCEDFADYACSQVVNSPRMGVCGYHGGQIDTERDIAFKG